MSKDQPMRGRHGWSWTNESGEDCGGVWARDGAVKTKILSPKLYPAYHYGLSREGPTVCRLQPPLQDSLNQWPANCQEIFLQVFF